MTEDDHAPTAPTELEVLKSRATAMGITFSNNIGVDALRAKVHAKMEGEEDPDNGRSIDPDVTTSDAAEQDELPTPGKNVAPPVKTLTKREQIDATRADQLNTQMRLVRLRISNMDPKKKDLPGEILTIGNDFIGTVKKFIPFGEFTDDGFHVPFCLYQMMKERKFLDIRTTKKGGQIQVTQRWVNEFALEELPPLTQIELDKLAAAQIAAGTFSHAGME
jgi:hypothetical protein